MLRLYVTLAKSWLVTFGRTSYADLLTWLRSSPGEVRMLSGIPLRGWMIGAFVALPMLASVGVLLVNRRHFTLGLADA